MAIRAQPRRDQVHSRERETGTGVIECAIAPVHGVMTGLTRSREVGGDVIHRSQRVRVIRLMARHARGTRQVVVVVDVAIGALARRNRM